MPTEAPTAELAQHFSSPGADPVAWVEAIPRLETAEIFWLSTVRPNGRPHVTPLIAVWLDGALYLSTSADERKYKNLLGNPHVVITTGCNALHEDIDLVIEGDAVRVSNESTLHRVADEFFKKYGKEWHFTVRDGAFLNPEGGGGPLHHVRPKMAFGFGRGEQYSQTRWRF